MTNSVLITGASGLIGRSLTEALLQKGCRVSHLGRSKQTDTVPAFLWDPDKGFFDERALQGVDTIIHLAGAGIADKRWSSSRKAEILTSRLKATGFLAEVLGRHSHSVKTIVAASAIGYYGPQDADLVLKETDSPGTDFLASVVVQWEAAMERLQLPDIRVVKIRIGIVLSDKGGALREMMAPIKWGVGSPLGDGKQMMSWIHIDDLCEMLTWAIAHPQVAGVFNAAAPNPVSNKGFTQTLAQHLGKTIWLPPVPGFVLRLILGEMADLVLTGSRVSGEKAINHGFRYRYENLNDALNGLPLR